MALLTRPRGSGSFLPCGLLSSAAPITCWADLGSVTTGSGALWDLATGCLPCCLFLATAPVLSLMRPCPLLYEGPSLSVHVLTFLGNPPGVPCRPAPPCSVGPPGSPRLPRALLRGIPGSMICGSRSEKSSFPKEETCVPGKVVGEEGGHLSSAHVRPVPVSSLGHGAW